MLRNQDIFPADAQCITGSLFQAKGLFEELDIAAMQETKTGSLLKVWLELGEALRDPIDAEFSEIFDICCKKGFLAIIDAVHSRLSETPEEIPSVIDTLSALPGQYHRAMIVFLDYQEFWKTATLFYGADTLSSWRKRRHLGHRPAVVDKASILQFSSQIADYFHYAEGCGKNCKVEFYRRDGRDYFFVYQEGHSQQTPEWVNGQLENHLHSPVFQVVFLYVQKEGSLDLNFKGSRKATEPLRSIFASTILKLDELPPDPKNNLIYDLNPLINKEFDFIFDVGSGIKNVAVKKMRLSSKGQKGRKITLDDDHTHDAKVIYKDLKDIDKSTPLHQFNVTQVELAVVMAADDDKPEKTHTIRITHPNYCDLKYDKGGLKLRDMLESSGIELKELMEGDTSDGTD